MYLVVGIIILNEFQNFNLYRREFYPDFCLTNMNNHRTLFTYMSMFP